MITTKDFYKGRDVTHAEELTPDLRANAEKLMKTVNALLLEINFGDRTANSGWRPYSIQMEINPRAPRSKHVTCNAIDVSDKDGKLGAFLQANTNYLVKYGLYMEDPKSTSTWCHLQQLPPASRRRIFKP